MFSTQAPQKNVGGGRPSHPDEKHQMQDEHYPGSADPSNTFSVSSTKTPKGQRSRSYWNALSAQWEVVKADLNRPDHRPKRNYPTPRLLQDVMILMCMNAKKENGHIFTSVDKLTSWLRLAPSSRRSVQVAIRALVEDFGMLELIRKEAPCRSRTYRITVGWKDSEQEQHEESTEAVEPFKDTVLRRAYKHARLERHQTAQIGRIQPATKAKLARLIDDLTVLSERSFEDVAHDLMATYMRHPGRADRRLVKEKHPAEWLQYWLHDLESSLRKRYKAQRERATPKEPRAPEQAPLSAEENAARFRALARRDRLTAIASDAIDGDLEPDQAIDGDLEPGTDSRSRLGPRERKEKIWAEVASNRDRQKLQAKKLLEEEAHDEALGIPARKKVSGG